MLTTQAPSAPKQGRRGRVAAGIALGALLIVALVGGLLYALVFGHSTPSPNQGKSVLVLSKPDTERIAAVTLLTMIRTSDGKVLWQYHLAGDLAGGLSGTADEQLRAGTAVHIVNGVVYFAEVLDARPDRPPLTTFSLTALRADTGARLWQHQMQATTLEVLGISDGVLVAQATTGTNYAVDALTATGYRADTGALVWERRLAEHIGYGGSPDQLFDGILYVRQVGAALPLTTTALDAHTGKQLWQSTSQNVGFVAPIAAADGVVVVEGGVPGGRGAPYAPSLSGVRERDGALLWSHELSPSGGVPGTLALPSFQASAGVLYFATNSPARTDLELNALQITHGTLLWHRQVTARQVITNQQSSGGRGLVLANGTLYLLYALSAPASSPADYGLFVQAVRASDGALGWGQIYHPGQGEDPGLAIVDGSAASAVVTWSTDSEHTPLLGLSAGDGTTLWHDQQTAYGELIADGKLLVFSVLPPPDNQFHEHLCALQPGSGATLWCTAVDGLGNWVVVGP
ncbi:MAG TPA: PQQ-binding-like beta-propeller repeat protein [Ktedonobacterales bacterium]|nr:PQQ-binding-like beta-propeller repeat protein [Ktedonobacterales bacterium]